MDIPMLVVDKDIEVSQREQEEWLKHGITTVRVDTMQEAIEKLSKDDFLFTAINGDNVNYMLLLRIMRSTSPSLIFIITSNFNVYDQVEAMKNGADVYTPFNNNTTENVELALALLLRCNERYRWSKEQENMIIYGNFIVSTVSRQIFCNDTKLELTKKEYDILYYMVSNHDCILTYKQIYRKVWGSEYDEMVHDILWNHIRKLRKKISQVSGDKEYIINERNVGYRFLISYSK